VKEQNKPITAEIIHLYDHELLPCIGCWACARSGKCHLQDEFESIYRKLEAADYVIIGIPNYWCNLPAVLVNFIQRHTAYAIWKPENAHKFEKISTKGEKIRKMLYCLRNFGPINPGFKKKRFIFIIAGTAPFRFLMGEYRGIMIFLRKYVSKLNARLYRTIFFTDTLFRIDLKKKDQLMKNAYKMGLKLKCPGE